MRACCSIVRFIHFLLSNTHIYRLFGLWCPLMFFLSFVDYNTFVILDSNRIHCRNVFVSLRAYDVCGVVGHCIVVLLCVPFVFVIHWNWIMISIRIQSCVVIKLRWLRRRQQKKSWIKNTNNEMNKRRNNKCDCSAFFTSHECLYLKTKKQRLILQHFFSLFSLFFIFLLTSFSIGLFRCSFWLFSVLVGNWCAMLFCALAHRWMPRDYYTFSAPFSSRFFFLISCKYFALAVACSL